MKEMIIPLGWEYIDGLLEQIDRHLVSASMPTILRMRTRVLTEELFSSLMVAEGAQSGRLRCTCPAPNQVCLQYRNERGPLAPDLQVLEDLLKDSVGYGVKARIDDGSCIFAVGVR